MDAFWTFAGGLGFVLIWVFVGAGVSKHLLKSKQVRKKLAHAGGVAMGFMVSVAWLDVMRDEGAFGGSKKYWAQVARLHSLGSKAKFLRDFEEQNMEVESSTLADGRSRYLAKIPDGKGRFELVCRGESVTDAKLRFPLEPPNDLVVLRNQVIFFFNLGWPEGYEWAREEVQNNTEKTEQTHGIARFELTRPPGVGEGVVKATMVQTR